MSDGYFTGQIIMFAGNFAPQGWELCDGRMLDIKLNVALYTIIGNSFGGAGTAEFALPDLRGRAPIHFGQGPDLPAYEFGEKTGQESTRLAEENLPPHSHQMMASAGEPTQSTAANGVLASNTRSTNPPMPNIYNSGSQNLVQMGSQTGPTGQNEPFGLVQPVLALNYIICLNGIYPARPE